MATGTDATGADGVTGTVQDLARLTDWCSTLTLTVLEVDISDINASSWPAPSRIQESLFSFYNEWHRNGQSTLARS